MKYFFLCCCLMMFMKGQAADKKYPVANIPAALVKNAHAVKRMEQIELKVIDLDEIYITRKYAITVFSEPGERFSNLVEYYDKFSQVKEIRGKLYDAQGNLLKTLKNKEVSDLSAVDDISLIDDNRRKVHQFYYKSYPYTVEYEVEIRSTNTLFYPAWIPVEGLYLSVEQSSYTVICNADYEVRYRSFNYSGSPEVSHEKNKKIMRFELKNHPLIEATFAAPAWRDMTTMVFFGPSDFKVQGYTGNMNSWKEFGKFQYSLQRNRDRLPEAVVSKVHELTAGINDPVEKIRVLFQYLQKNTRYISIQLGLGGWQPFEASYVAQKGYGDCKALTNYMHSLLKVAGIRSNPALIRAGEGYENYIVEDFPSSQFNHMILCVPLERDTMWLECTSQTAAAGYMGEFTGNRKALLIDENGGTLVSTPRYTRKENILDRKVDARLDREGNLQMKVSTTYGGVQQDDLSMMVNQLSREKLQKILHANMELSTYQVNDFRYEENKSILPELKETLDITANKYATITGKRIFIVPNILNRNGRKLEEDTSRKVDYVFAFEYHDVDHYEISIPEGYEPESIPQEVSIVSRFGTYHSSMKLENNKIIYHRVMEKYAGRFPVSSGKEMVKFFSDIYKADRAKMVLVRKD